MRKLSVKGQESAPFELLVAAILMSFVIVIGLQAVQVLRTTTCEGNLKQNLEQIKTAIESVVKNKSKENVSFTLPECFEETKSTLRVIERDELDYCSAVCGGSLSQCTVLQFSSESFNEQTCLRVSSATTFPEGDPCDVQVLTGNYSIANWKEQPIQEGDYTLIKQFNLYSDAPVICVYKRGS